MNSNPAAPLPFSRIVAFFDVGERGVPALSWFAPLADRCRDGLLVVQSAVNVSTEHSPDDEQAFLGSHDEAAHRWLSEHGVDATVVSIDADDVSDAIIERARPDDLVVIGPTAPGTATPSTRIAGEIVRRVACPVVLIPETYEGAPDGPIVVGVDGSDDNYGVLEFAQDLAASTGHTLRAVYVEHPIYDTFDNADDYGDDERRARREADAVGVRIEERSGAVDAVLDDAARSSEAFLTVIGHGHHRLTDHLDFLHPVRRLLHDPPGPIAILPAALADHHLRRDRRHHRSADGILHLTDDELSRLGEISTVLTLTDDGTEPGLSVERLAAARLAARLRARLVLVDRSHESWTATPGVNPPADIEAVRARGDEYLAAQMFQARSMGVPEVIAYAPSTPTFGAIVDVIRTTDADVVVVPDRLDHPHLAERWQHHGDVGLAIRATLDDLHIVTVHDGVTLRLD